MSDISCVDCVFFRTVADTKIGVDKHISARTCQKLRIVLDRPDWSVLKRDEELRSRASNCVEFKDVSIPGTIRKVEKWAHDGLVKVAHPTISAQFSPENVTSCNGCSNFVPQPEVTSETGWTAPVCVARGALITGRNLSLIASDCDYKSWRSASPIRTIQDLNLWDTLQPEEVDAYGDSKSTLIDDFIKDAAPDWAEPTLYETDKPLDEDDIAHGIRAWRKIVNPEESRIFTYLPVFDVDFFTPEDQAKIPRSGDEEHPELYFDFGNHVYTLAVLWMEVDATPSLWGDAGVGKTELYRHMAWMMCLPFERISITIASEIDDLAGKMNLIARDGQSITEFSYGRIPKAWNRSCVLCIDEPNVGPNEVWQFLRPLTDNSKQLVLDQSGGERISRAMYCFPGMAMNPDWDPKNEGTQTIAAPDRSRISHVFMELPSPEIEKKIIASRIALDGWQLETKYLDQMMTIAKTLRENCNSGAIPGTWGIRDQVKVALLLRWFSPIRAYRIAAADGYPPQVAALIQDTVNVTMRAELSPIKKGL